MARDSVLLARPSGLVKFRQAFPDPLQLYNPQRVHFAPRNSTSKRRNRSMAAGLHQPHGGGENNGPSQSIIEVGGYADDTRSVADNFVLSGIRAEVTARFVAGVGVPPGRIRVLALGALDPDSPPGDRNFSASTSGYL